LEQTATLWPEVRTAFAWVHQVAVILRNEAQQQASVVRGRLRGLLGAMTRWKTQAGDLSAGIEHFLKVTRSYWSGLFHCYDIDGLPRTNNDLEQVFGKWRHHQRRCTGRKVAPATAVTRGAVQLVAALATQRRSYSDSELASVDRTAWQQVREQLKTHQYKRVQQRRFRQNSTTYLAALEQQLLKLTLLL
jgi:hypothetical protein